MSVQAMGWVLDHSQQKGGCLLALLAIANHAKSDGTGAWPSVRTIAREARLSESQAHRCIRALVRSGELVVETGCGPNGTNLYHLPNVRQLSLGLPQPELSTGVANCDRSHGCARGVAPVRPEPSLNSTVSKKELGASGARSIPLPVEKQKANPRARWAMVRDLRAEGERRIEREGPDYTLADLREDLKTFAASRGMPYFDALPGANGPIEQALALIEQTRNGGISNGGSYAVSAA